MKKFLFFVLVLTIGNMSFADKLSDIKRIGVLKAGVKYDFKPFGFLDNNNRPIGFDIDLIKYIARDLGVRAEFSQVTSNDRISSITSGKVDIVAASMTHKIQRDFIIDFTISYFFDGQSMLVKRKSKTGRNTGFVGKKIGVILGATSGENFKKAFPKSELVHFKGYAQAIEALKKDEIYGVSTDLVWCSVQAKDSNGEFKSARWTISFEPYGMGVPENESNFRDAVNFSIQKSVKDGYYEKIYKKWFGVRPRSLPELWP